MVRVGSLQERANLARSQKDKDKRENKTNMTAEEQLNAIMPKVAHLQEDCDKYYEKALENLDACGYKKVNFDAMDKEQERFWKKIFQNESCSPSSARRSWTTTTRSRSCAIRRSTWALCSRKRRARALA